MGLGREVADAYISVHGDLSPFRKDLEGAAESGRKAAIESANAFSDEWNNRMERQVSAQWHNIVDAMYKNDKVSWERLLGDTSSIDQIDEKFTEITDLMSDMVDEGKMLNTEFEKTFDVMEDIVGKMKDRAKIEKDFTEAQEHNNQLQREAKALQEQIARGTQMAAEANRKLFAEGAAENERWSRTLDGMRKNGAIAGLEADFKKLAETMNSADMAKFSKSFDNLHQARARIYEVTAAMEQQGRISRAQSEEMQKNINDYISSVEMQKRLEEEAASAKAKAMKDALDATNAARVAQDKYNASLSGMARNIHFGKLESEFRNLAAAMDSNDFSHFAQGAIDIEHMRRKIAHTANEMRRLGRMTDTEYGLILDKIQELNHSFSDGGRGGGNFFRTLSDGANNFGRAMGRVNNATRGFREHLQSFAGLNVFGDMVRKGLDFIHNLDSIALKLGKASTLMGSMASIGGSSLAGLVVIASDLAASFGGLAAIAPGFLIGAGIGAGVLVASFKDLTTVLKDLGPQFSKLQDNISAKFWAQAEKPIRNLTKNLFPVLDKQLQNTGTAFGKVFGALAKAIDEVPSGLIEKMFVRMNEGIEIAAGAMKPLVNAFTTLGLGASMYFKRFGTWITDLSQRFDNFIQAAAKDGRLLGWIDNMIEGFKDIGRSIDGTLGIFNALDSAARAAGSGGLKEFADKLQGIAATMQSPRFQKTMTQLFLGMNIAVGKIGNSIKALGPALESVMPTVQRALVDIGTVAGRVIDYFGQIISNPVVQKGITDFSNSMVQAINRLEPAIKPFGDSLGTMLTLLGEIVESVAKIGTTFMVELSPVLDRIGTKLGTLVQPLADGVSKFLTDMKGPLETIERVLVGPLVDAINNKLIPAITGPGGFSEEFAKFVTRITEAAGPSFKTLVNEVLPNLVDTVTELLDPLGKFIAFFTPTLNQVLKETAEAIKGIGDAVKFMKGEIPIGEIEIFKPGALDKAVKKAEEDFEGAWESRGSMSWGDIFSKILGGGSDAGQAFGIMWTEKIFPGIKTVWEDVIVKGITMIFEGRMFGDEVKKNLDDFWADDARIAEDIDRDVNQWFEDHVFKPMGELGKTIGQLWDDTIGAFWDTVFGGGGGEVVAGGGGGGGTGGRGMSVTGKLDPAMLGLPDEEGTKSWFEEFGTWLYDGITGAFARLAEALGLNTFAEDWKIFWDSLPVKVQETWDAIVLWTTTKAGEIKAAVDTFIADTKLNWDNFWNGVRIKVEEIWNAVKTWIDTKVNEIKTKIDTFVTETKTNWDTFWNGVKSKVEEVWNGVRTFIETKVREIKTNIDNFIRDVKTNWDNFWRTVGDKVRTGWDDIVRGFQTGVDRAVEWVRSLPGKAVAALGDLGGRLRGHGEQMIDGFRKGLESKFEDVKRFVGTIANWIAEHKGPISYDKVLLIPAGKAIMDGLGVGLRSQLPALKNTLDTVTDAMNDAITTGFAKSKMYLAGAEAALGLANGLKDNKAVVFNAVGQLLPPQASVSISSAGNMAGVGTPTPGPQKVINIESLTIPVSTPTENPEIVAAKVIDEFAATISNI